MDLELRRQEARVEQLQHDGARGAAHGVRQEVHEVGRQRCQVQARAQVDNHFSFRERFGEPGVHALEV